MAAQMSRNGRSRSCTVTTGRMTVPVCEPPGWRAARIEIDRGIDFYKTTILPALEELDGFCSASLLLDQASRCARRGLGDLRQRRSAEG